MRMKCLSVLGLVLVVRAFVAPAIGQDTQPVQLLQPESVSAVGCSTNVPAIALTGAPVQFQANVSGPPAGSLWATDSIVGNLRFVPATGPGGFTQGQPASESCLGGTNTFTHILTRNIAVMETAVTRQMWASLQSAQPGLPADPSSLATSSGLSDPVQRATWDHAILFANLLSVQQGQTLCYTVHTPFPYDNDVQCDFNANGYRLPTEGEREYFTRAGTTGPFSIDEPNYLLNGKCFMCTGGLFPSLESVAWYCANAGSTTHPAGSKSANPWGLKDAHGNVWEWCWDWHVSSYPVGTATDYTSVYDYSNDSRVLRGGGFDYNPPACESGNRFYNPHTSAGVDEGFRLVRTLPTNYDWNFGDGTAHGTLQNPTHAYSTPGTYNWAMTVNMGGQLCVQTGQIVVSSTCTGASISTQPASQTIHSGQSAILTVVPGGSAPYQYQWYQNTSHPVGTDSDSLSTGSLAATTSYWVHVTNGCGQADSDTATVTVSGGSGVNISNIKSKTSKAGSTATIFGTGFATDKKKDVVYFGTKKATIKKANTTSLSVKIPKGLKGTVDVYVVVNGQKSNTWPFPVK